MYTSALHRYSGHLVAILIDDRHPVACKFQDGLCKCDVFLFVIVYNLLAIRADAVCACMGLANSRLFELLIGSKFDQCFGDDHLFDRIRHWEFRCRTEFGQLPGIYNDFTQILWILILFIAATTYGEYKNQDNCVCAFYDSHEICFSF